MKYLLRLPLIVLFFLLTTSCTKTGFIESSNASINFSADTLHYDTIFTTTGSVTQSFKIFNPNDQKLRLTNIKLMGGSTSSFKMNVDGTSGTDLTNLELEANDSLYVFVSVTINPNTATLPFIVQDSILVSYNGNQQYIQLQAYGQNGNFLRNQRISRDTSWNNNLPYVIVGGVTVDSNVTLTINKGCRIYMHADAAVIVNGSLKVNGEVDEKARVLFMGDRLDADYRDFPGSWPGIFFSSSSAGNVLNYAIIKNAYQGVITQSYRSIPKITLKECIIDNIYDAGILSVGSSIKAINCLISNCGSNIVIAAGGSYSFDHCTVATIGSLYINHKEPVLKVTNAYDENLTFPLNAAFRNCIFFGENGTAENEVIVERKGTNAAFDVVFENVLYKNKVDLTGINFVNSIKNEFPQFDSVNAGKNYYDFHLKPNSPAIDRGKVTGIARDLDDKLRGSAPDIGCYEK